MKGAFLENEILVSKIIDVFKTRNQNVEASSFYAEVLSPDGQVFGKFEFQSDRIVYPASTIKTLIAMSAMNAIDAGKLSLSQLVEIDQSNADVESNDWGNAYKKGQKLTIKKLIEDTITVSNNISTNQLIDLADRNQINADAKRLGADSIKLFRKLYNHLDSEPHLVKKNEATSRGLAALYREVITGTLGFLKPRTRKMFEDLLGRQTLNDRMNAKWKNEAQFFHKTGSTSDSSSDSGYFYRPDGKAVILVGLQANRDFEVLADIGLEMYRWGKAH